MARKLVRSIAIDKELYDKLKEIAESNKVSVSSIVRIAISYYLRKVEEIERSLIKHD